MDVLADWARITGMSGVVLARSRLESPWGMALAPGPAMFHVVLEGTCWLRHAESPPRALFEGDMVLLPAGSAHELAHEPAGPAVPLRELLERPPAAPTGAPATTILCGAYRSNTTLTEPLLRGLPEVVYYPAARVRETPSLSSTLALLTAEFEASALGSEWLLEHLCNTLFVYLIRSWTAEAGPHPASWLSALRDPALSRAMSRMHAAPQASWTVEKLAREANLSRAAFARRFTEHVGESPLAYLTRWRMGLAAQLLRDTDASLVEVAARVGYESEFSFSRAFKRSRGVSPTPFRRAER